VARAVFEIFKDNTTKFGLRLRASNNEAVAVASQGYESKQSCLKGIESIKRKNAPDAEIKYEIWQNETAMPTMCGTQT
jgi:hypothetical protein